MKYFSADYKDEIRKHKNVGFMMLVMFLGGLVAVFYDPEGRGWIVMASAIFGYSGHFISGGKKHVKKGEFIIFNESTFDYRVVKTGYHIEIPYKDIRSVEAALLPPKSIKINLSENRVHIMKNYSNIDELLAQLRNRARI